MNETVLRLEIRGHVQGVGYRATMVYEARRRGLTGWVRNRLDGSVEALVAGPDDRVQQLVAWARRGPGMARVAEVKIYPASGHHDRFEERPTA